MKVISIVNHKGGVGKTTTTLNLGKALSLLGKKVLMIDMDPQANLTLISGIKEDDIEITINQTLLEEAPLTSYNIDDNLWIVPSDLSLAVIETKLAGQIDNFFKLQGTIEEFTNSHALDYILIDCPPSLGLLTNNALIASTDVIIPVQAQFLAAAGLNNILEIIEKLDKTLKRKTNLLGILITQIKHTTISKASATQISTLTERTFQTQIRENVALQEASAARTDIFSYAKNSPGAEDYRAVAFEIIESK